MKAVYKKLFEFRKLTSKVVKGSKNPFFKSDYADLNSVIEATDPALEEVGLIYIDRVDKEVLISEIIDPESGEAIQNTIPLILGKKDMQQLGSAITYARRYARMSLLGLQAVDDDGNFVSGKTAAPIEKTPKATQDDVLTIRGLISQTSTDIDKFLSVYKVKKIDDLDSVQAESAITLLTKKLTKAS